MPKISVVLTLYNAAKYLKQCFESILFQDYSDIEVVAVINGRSSDSTEAMVSSYAQQDERVRVIHNKKEISTVGEGLELGISRLKGDYFTIIDGDDYLMQGALRALYDTAKYSYADIVVGDIQRVDMNGSFLDNVGLPSFDCLDRLSYMETSLWYMDYLYHGKLYKTDLLKKRNVVFLPVLVGADRLLHYQMVLGAQKISRYKKIVHNYRCNTSSLSNNITLERLEGSLNCYLYLDELFEKEGLYENENIETASKAQGLILVSGCLLNGQNKFYVRYKEKVDKLLNGDVLNSEKVISYLKGWPYYFYTLNVYRYNKVLGCVVAYILNKARTSCFRVISKGVINKNK